MATCHFSEERDGRYVNPLRPGAWGRSSTTRRPEVRSVVVRRTALLDRAETYDETPLAVPRPWHDLPVMPAFVRWRLLDAWAASSRLDTVADFSRRFRRASDSTRRGRPGTMQNQSVRHGRYGLGMTASLQLLPARSLRVQVAPGHPLRDGRSIVVFTCWIVGEPLDVRTPASPGTRGAG